MPSDWQTANILLTGGLDTKTDSKVLAAPKLSVLENGIFASHGTLQHRAGYDVTAPTTLDGSTVSKPVGLASRDNELVLAADGKLHSYDDTTNRWLPIGPLEYVTTAQAGLASTNSAQQFTSVCTHNGVTVAAWQDSRGGVYASAYSSVTGAPFVVDKLLEVNGRAPALVVVDGIILCLWYNVSTFDIGGLRISPSAVETSMSVASVIVRSNASNTVQAFDVVSLGTTAALVYATDITGEEVHLAIINQGGVAQSSTAISRTSLVVQAVAVAASSSSIWTSVVLNSGASTSHVEIGTWPLASISTGRAYRLETGVATASRTAIATYGASAIYYWQETAAEDYNHVVRWRQAYTPPLTLPSNAAEWATNFPSLTVPNSLYPLQDTATPVLDTIGTVHFSAYGSAPPYVTFGVAGDPLARNSITLGNDTSTASRAAHLRESGTSAYDLDAVTSLTGMVRFKFNQTPALDQFLMRRKAVSVSGIGWAIQTDPSGFISIVVDSASATASSATISVNHNDGAYHFIMASIDRTAQTATIYSDLGTATVSIAAHGTLSNSLRFGLGDTEGNLTACARGEYSWAFVLSGQAFGQAAFDLISSVVAPSTPPASKSIRHSKLATGAFEQGNYTFVHLMQQSTLQSTYFLHRSDDHLCGRYNYGLAGDQSSSLRLPSVQKLSDNTWGVALRTKRRLDIALTSTGSDKYTHDNFKRTVHSFVDSTSFHAVQSGGATYIAGGFLWQYDGATPVESGFMLFPENGSSSVSATAGLIPDGTYNYRVYYEWTNGAGERERSSAVSFQLVHAAGASRKITIVCPTLAHTLKKGLRSNVALVLYRTESLGTSYYRCSSPDPTTTGDNAWLANSPTVNTVTFTDNMPDATLRTKDGDYQNSGEFDNIAPDSGTILARTASRLFLAGGCVPSNTVLHSKVRGLGQPAGEFNGNLVIRVDEEGGPITALAELNGDLIIFKRDRVYAISGDGPNDVGGGSYYGTPRLITSDVGCSKPRTVVLTPAGLMFVSERGIYVLNPSQGVQYIGAEVETFNTQDYTGAIVVPKQNIVVFIARSGKSVVFDYLFNQWSTWTNHTGIGVVLWRGNTLSYLDADCRVLRQNAALYTDGGVPYSLHFRLAPVRPPGSGVQGHWRLRRISPLGKYLSSHKLVMSLYYDRDTSPREVVEFDPDSVLNLSEWGDADFTWGSPNELWGGTGTREYQFELRVANQKCETVALDFYDIPGVPAGAGFELTEIALEWAPKTGLTKQSESRKV